MERCLYNTDPDEGDLVQSFLTQFIPSVERELFQEAMDNFDSADYEDLCDTLSNYDGRVIPNDQNIWKVINEVAHHQMVQKPSFIIECWSPILQSQLLSILTKEQLGNLYEHLQPSAKKVLSILKIPEAKGTAFRNLGEFVFDQH